MDTDLIERTTNEVHDEKIGCMICGARVHLIKAHLDKEHTDVSLSDYKERYPEAPLLSDKAVEVARAKRAQLTSEAVQIEGSDKVFYSQGFTSSTQPLHKLFNLGRAKAALGHRGNEIPITVLESPKHLSDYVPLIDKNYIFNIDLLKTVLLGFETGINIYLWGHMGTGKSTLFEQVSAFTKRPMMRVQHTRDTESSHIVGQWIVKDSQTVFELGPLAYCMKHGLTYLADEYDFAMPAVLAVYQPVLEGKALIIKEADETNRIIKPHPMFRFAATGNTNGTGDETGLYQGTLIQNAANYERFGIVEEVRYMDAKIEVGVIAGQGGIDSADAEKLVGYATLIREAFSNGKIGLPISPRSLINAAQLGRRLGSFVRGLELSYVNRLSRVDQEAAREVLKRTSL